MYAIIEVADKQYKVSQNDKLYVPRLEAEENATITIDRVLLVSGNGDIHVGAPTVEGAQVTAKVLAHVKADKILVFRKIRRKRFKVKNGHRQQYTQIQISDLTLGTAKKATRKKAEEAPAGE
ncbi:MAG: 50S ribosomal protein L21 [Rhodothermales bacterium]|nr:50S ribosomal protein L21 [Rhodothermales bacterium]